eukprot:scaffold48943_cov68-Cyclotella_meneghiniana.AAC.6
MTVSSSSISQTLFDEALLENEEAFDLSPDEALQETIDQFLSQLGVSNNSSNSTDNNGSSNTNNNEEYDAASSSSSNHPLAHLVLLHPTTTKGRQLRESHLHFQTCWTVLDRCVAADGSVVLPPNNDNDYEEEKVLSALRTISDSLRGETSFPYLSIVRNESCIYTLLSFLGIMNRNTSNATDNNDECPIFDKGKDAILFETIKALIACLTFTKDQCCNTIRVELKDVFVSGMGCLVSLSKLYLRFHNQYPKEESGDVMLCIENTILHIFQLATLATKQCESSKVNYVSCGGVQVISTQLHTKSFDNNNRIMEATCNLLSSLCRYDDFRENKTGLQTSSVHDHAMEFHRVGGGVEGRLIELARLSMGGEQQDGVDGLGDDSLDVRLAVASLTSLRVLAVNDDIIQTMVALGILPVVTKALKLSCNNPEENENNEEFIYNQSRLASASLGLLRNLCGNDEIKTNLCLGSSDQKTSTSPVSTFSTPSSLPYLIRAMQNYPHVAILQEHGCGTLAAMALRKPANAHAIINQDGPRVILNGMKRHDSNSNVQRQGALAIRNLVSRLLRECPEDGEKGKEERLAIRDLFLDLGAEDVLRNVTGRHQGSVDEAYAALRDLGCKVSLVTFSGDEQQQVDVVQKTMMFGEKHNTNFRPVYDDSVGLEKGVEEAISQFG